MTHLKFVVLVLQGLICVMYMEKHARSTFALVVPSELNLSFLKKKRVALSIFVVPVFQESNLSDIDGKTVTFYVRLSGSKRSFGFSWF